MPYKTNQNTAPPPPPEQPAVAFPGTASREHRTSTASKSEESEWSFENIKEFLSIEGGELDIKFKDANAAELKRGHLIYVEDNDSRLQGRILVVIRQKKSKAYFTCLAVCQHWRAFEELSDHWLLETVASGNEPRKDLNGIRDSQTIQIKLSTEPPSPEHISLALRKRTTVDVWSLWHVAHNVRVMVLGSVTDCSLEALGRKVAEVTLAGLPGCKQLELHERSPSTPEIASKPPSAGKKKALPLRERDKNQTPQADKKSSRK